MIEVGMNSTLFFFVCIILGVVQIPSPPGTDLQPFLLTGIALFAEFLLHLIHTILVLSYTTVFYYS